MAGVLGFSPLATDIAFLPFVAGAIVAPNLVSNLVLDRLCPRIVVPVGLLVAAVGAEWLARVNVHAGYGIGVAPALAMVERPDRGHRARRRLAFTVLAVILVAGAVTTGLVHRPVVR
jgi:hypothetical protein